MPLGGSRWVLTPSPPRLCIEGFPSERRMTRSWCEKSPKTMVEVQIEGPDVRGKRIVVVEDTSTTGGSPLTAARAIEKAGGEVVAVCVVVDRDTGADRVIE